ncbi:MAG: hypothetical protein KC416_01730 [Myxococcales bacterium]|nr:hypothetical protein [Myxococcales bacterium]
MKCSWARGAVWLASAVAAILLGSCESSQEPATTTRTTAPVTENRRAGPAPSGKGPSVALDTVPPPQPTGAPTIALGCATEGDARRIWAEPGPPATASDGRDLFVAHYGNPGRGQEFLRIVRLSEGKTPAEHARVPLPRAYKHWRIAPPGLAVHGGNVAAVAIGGGSRVWLLSPDLSDWVEVGAHADIRFAPAVAAGADGRHVAYTRAEGGEPRVWMVEAPVGRDIASRNVTPAGQTGAAPSFVVASPGPDLVFLDPRAGVSTILRWTGAGGPGDRAAVARPVGMAAPLPEIAGVLMGQAPLIAYSVIGNGATTAIGLVNLAERDGAPRALVPGTAYGVLHLSAAAGGKRAVFATDVATAPAPDSPRQIHLRVVDHEHIGSPLLVVGPDGTAAHGAVAFLGGGRFAVAFTAVDGIFVQELVCDA